MTRRACVQHVSFAIQRASLLKRWPERSQSRLQSSLRSTKTVPPPAKTLASPSTIFRVRALGWVLASLTAGATAFYSGVLLVRALDPCHNPAIVELSQQKDVSSRYDDTADSFDSEVGLSEFLMGINRTRKQLAQICTGHVLEVSCGTGRNLGYYDITKASKIDSMTFVDLSPRMIEVCKRKWNVLLGSTTEADILEGTHSLKPGMVVRFLTASALDVLPPAPTKSKYDTIIQTFGLCSTPSPYQLLLTMIQHLDTSNPEARIILLEHGRSYRPWLNRVLDNAAEKHAEIHGCWFNRDIGALVKHAARQTGLQVVTERRHHLGTTWIFELKPSPEVVAKASAAKGKAPEQARSTSWRSWLGIT